MKDCYTEVSMQRRGFCQYVLSAFLKNSLQQIACHCGSAHKRANLYYLKKGTFQKELKTYHDILNIFGDLFIFCQQIFVTISGKTSVLRFL